MTVRLRRHKGVAAMRHGTSKHRWAALSCLAALLLGCVQGPFTKPAKVVLYEDRSGKAAPSATPARRGSALPTRHAVKSGETVYAVANRYRVPIRTLIELNV